MSNLSELLGGGGGAGADFQEFTSSGTWTKPADAQFVRVEVWAAGGGGEGGAAQPNPFGFIASSNGGGGGGYMTRTFNASELSATEPVVVGAGGSGGAAPDAPGTAGGNSSFSSRVTTYGGGAGTGADAGKGGRGWGDTTPVASDTSPYLTMGSVAIQGLLDGYPPSDSAAYTGIYGGGSGGRVNGPIQGITGGSSVYAGGGGGGTTGPAPQRGGSNTGVRGGGGALNGGNGVKLGDGGGGGSTNPGGNGAYAGGGGGGPAGGSGGPGIVRVYTW